MHLPRRNLILLASLLLAAPAHAQHARLTVDVDSLVLGEPFELEVVVERPATGQVIFPRPPAGDIGLTAPLRAGDVELRELRRLPPVTHPPDMRTDRAVYEAVGFEVDSAVVGPIEVLFVAGSDTTTLVAEAAVVPVRRAVEPDELELRPPAPPAAFERSTWPWVLAAVAALLLLAVLVGGWWRRRRSRRSRINDPAALALWRLDEMAGQLRGPGEAVKPFYASLAEVVRTYLQDRLGRPALEVTTRELLQLLRSEPSDIPPEALTHLRSLLETSDLVKFADAIPPSERHPQALAEARSVVDLTETAILQREAAEQEPDHHSS